MKIDKTSKPTTTSNVGGSTSAGKGRAAPRPSGEQSSTKVDLGSTTAQLQNMESSMASSPVVNAEKVAEVKLAIDEGRFKVNSEVVADKLIETTGNMINNKA